MELSEKMLSELPLLFLTNSFKRSEHKSKQAITYNGFNKVNRESVRYSAISIFDDDSYKQTQKENNNAEVKSVKSKKTFSKSRTKEAVMGKGIPMADYLHTMRNFTLIIIMNACSMSCKELIEIRAALRKLFGDKVPYKMKIAIINKSDESSSKLKEWRTELENNNIEIIDHLPRSDYEFLFKKPVELPGDFRMKGSKGDMLELLKLWGGRRWTETDDQKVEVDLVGGVSGRPVTEDGVNNNLTEEGRESEFQRTEYCCDIKVNLSRVLNAICRLRAEYIFNVIHSNGRHDIDGEPIWNKEVYAVITMFDGEKEENKIFKNRRRHCAEKFMLKYLEDFTRIEKLKAFLSSSPCFKCCQRIIKFKRNRKRTIDIEIVCSARYRARQHYCLREKHTHRMPSKSDHNKSIKGLRELKQDGVVIRPPSREDWFELNKILESNLTKNEMITKIQERSKDDEEMIQDFRELKLVSDSNDDSEDYVPDSQDILSIAVAMNFIHRPEGWHRKNNTPEAENSTVTTREAHPAGDDLQREEDKLDEATGGA